MRNVVIDVQFFKTQEKQFTAKELAAYDGEHFAHYLFKPPFPFNQLQPHLQTQAQWLIRNHHSIPWEEGFVPAHLCGQILCHLVRDAINIFVKGREKANFVRNMTSRAVMELPEEPSLLRMKPSCVYHSSETCMCSLTNVFNLYNSYVMN